MERPSGASLGGAPPTATDRPGQQLPSRVASTAIPRFASLPIDGNDLDALSSTVVDLPRQRRTTLSESSEDCYLSLVLVYDLDRQPLLG